MTLEELYKEIMAQLKKSADPVAASRNTEKAERFNINHKYYGLTGEVLRDLITQYEGQFSQLELIERFHLIRMFYCSGISEQIAFGDTIMVNSLDEISPSHFEYLEDITDCLSNWGDTDWFASRITQPLLLKYPEETLSFMRDLNSSENMWKRRLSVVTFTRKIGESGKFTEEALELCNNLIWDTEDLVRKGVGWALKDTMRGAKKRVLEYVKSLRGKGVSSVITLYAIRDLKGEERREVLAVKQKETNEE
ncbi:MAG: DNA alkylation repair protein [Candidatus Methanofastidiosia archaeon]